MFVIIGYKGGVYICVRRSLRCQREDRGGNGVVIYGHSFVSRLREDIENGVVGEFNLGLSEYEVEIRGEGGLTVHNIMKRGGPPDFIFILLYVNTVTCIMLQVMVGLVARRDD
jgi:hypothetical protein